MCLEESFCPFTKDALNFRPPKICASPHRPAVFFRLLSSSRHHCAVWCSVQYSALSFCSVTAQAHRKSRVRSNNAPTRNVYVTLVYVFLIAVALLCFDMLWYSWSVQCWSNLLHWSAPRYALLAFADNTALPGFLYFYICFITPNHIFYSFPDDLRDLMSINSYYAIISLWMYGRDARFPLTRTHTHTEARVTSRGHKHTNDISRTALRVTSWAFHHLIWVKLSSSYTHRNVKVFTFTKVFTKVLTATRQNKSRIFEDIAAEIFVQQNVNNTTTKIMKTCFFKE